MNKHKGFVMKGIWFKSEEEYKELVNALDTNDKEKALDTIFKIHLRGDL